MQKGQPITFRIPEVSDETFNAEIYLVGKTIDLQSRMTLVHAHVTKAPRFLLPGMFVEATVELKAESSSFTL